MARANFVAKARKDIPGTDIKKGDSYYWWKFRHGGKHYSKTRPRPSQLTQSDFYSQVYGMQEEIEDVEANDGLPDFVEDIASRLEDLASECEDKVQNMPEGLQQGSTAELLTERAEACRNAAEEFRALDLSEWDENFDEPEREDDDTDETYEAKLEAAREEAEQAWWDEKLDAVREVSIDAP